MILDKTSMIAYITLYLYIVVFCFIGSMIRDSYNTITEKIEKVEFARVLVSTITSSIFIFSLSDYLLSKGNYKILILISFIGGMIGFEALGYLTRLTFWMKILKKKINIDIDIDNGDGDKTKSNTKNEESNKS